jgi:hypothetical chaperone protein
MEIPDVHNSMLGTTMNVLGLDFGTTNTVIAASDAAGNISPLVFRHNGTTHSSLRTAICYWRDHNVLAALQREVGQWAIDRFLEDPYECRFIQSFKTFAASAAFTSTQVYTRRCGFEDLLSDFLEQTFHRLKCDLRHYSRRIVVGRPVVFAGSHPNTALAVQRYRSALQALGFEAIVFVFEPVAAAVHFATELKSHATVLVADFGGGTTDFSLVDFYREAQILRARSRSHGGIGIAGDTFDFRIIDQVILPRIGKGTTFRSTTGTQLPIANHYFQNFAKWNVLSLMKHTRDFRNLKDLIPFSSDRDRLELFISLIDANQGYPLYAAVTSVKERLSMDPQAIFSFAPLGNDFHVAIRRQEFEKWIADDLLQIEKALDDTLERGGATDRELDYVFLTGGSSFVPAVKQLFTRRFGREKVATGDQLLAIASGLGQIGRFDEPERWMAVDL